ncbi:MAG: beta-propeller fold lactonase family protein, partial [Spirochaetia bacterium]
TPFGIAISPDGNYLYVTNIGSATGASGISAFRINSDGTLFPITLTASGSTTGKYPAGIAIVP